MATGEWNFPDAPWFDGNPESVRLVAERDSERFACAISSIALNDAHGTADTPAAALQNYKANADQWNRIVVAFIENGKRGADGVYRVTSDFAKTFGMGC